MTNLAIWQLAQMQICGERLDACKSIKSARPFGIVMSVFLGACLLLGQLLAAQTTAIWLLWGIGLFVVGWVFQFVGHNYEGKKPAFVDDIMGPAIGPIFAAAELAFELGLRKDVQHAVEARVGPTFIRQAKVA